MPSAHILPSGLPSRLDLREPPDNPAKAPSYHRLVALLEEFGRVLDLTPAGHQVSRGDFRQWEQRVTAELQTAEIDLFMRVPDDDFDTARLPEQRWRNLRDILLRRKGLL